MSVSLIHWSAISGYFDACICYPHSSVKREEARKKRGYSDKKFSPFLFFVPIENMTVLILYFQIEKREPGFLTDLSLF